MMKAKTFARVEREKEREKQNHNINKYQPS